MWFFYSILGLLFLGLGDFLKKAMLKSGGNKDIYLFMCFVFYIIALVINYIFSDTEAIDTNTISSAFIIGFFDFLAPIGLIAALKYLDTSLAFISIRLTASFLILYIGMYILGDNLSIYNIIGFLIGAIAIFLLSGFNFKEKHKIHKKGILAVLIALIGTVCSHSYFKYIVNDIDIDSYTLLKFSVSFLFIILYMTIRKKFKKFNIVEIKKVSTYAFSSCVIFITYFLYIIPNIYKLGTLSLSFKFLSYSIIVPIILSTIIYKEKITKKRLLAFILTILSIGLFLF